MFDKKTKNTKNNNSNNENNDNKKNSDNSLKSWITGKLGSFIFLSAAGYALYKFGIISKITNYFKPKEKPKSDNSNATNETTY